MWENPRYLIDSPAVETLLWPIILGLTRDRKYGEGEFLGRRFMVIDTGGISGEEEGIDAGMAEQSLLAMDEADIVLFMVDCRAGIVAADFVILNNFGKTARSML